MDGRTDGRHAGRLDKRHAYTVCRAQNYQQPTTDAKFETSKRLHEYTLLT